jgi:hypothetical protein
MQRKMYLAEKNVSRTWRMDSNKTKGDKSRYFSSKVFPRRISAILRDEHLQSRAVVKPSPWAEGAFEEKMAMLLRWANTLNRSDPAFAEAQCLLEPEDSVIGRVIRRAKMNEQME